jgi:glycosyltransferase involved in cell wall biosynthesis
VNYFSPTADDPADIAAAIGQRLLADAAFRLRRRVMREYSWARILRAYLQPLVEGREEPGT